MSLLSRFKMAVKHRNHFNIYKTPRTFVTNPRLVKKRLIIMNNNSSNSPVIPIYVKTIANFHKFSHPPPLKKKEIAKLVATPQLVSYISGG